MRAFLAVAAALAAATAAAAGSPVDKVVVLIKDLKARIEGDADSESKVYNKFACWCEKTAKEKAFSIRTAKNQIRRSGRGVLRLRGMVATLESEIASLSKRISRNEASQAKATAMRSEGNGVWQAGKAESEETIGALERAIKVLSGAGTKTELVQQQALSELLEPKVLAMLSPATADAAYSPQSATVIGILREMYSSFARDLEDATRNELVAQGAYERLMAEKEEQPAVLSKTRTRKELKRARRAERLAEKEQYLADTRAQLEHDTTFFDGMDKQCRTKSAEYDHRVELRTEELEGINRALDLLTSDEARELFSSSISGKSKLLDGAADDLKVGTAFLQTSAPRLQAAAALTTSAKETHSLRLAVLASKLRDAGHFDTVLQEISVMLSNLDEEEQADQDHRDQCIKETHDKTETSKKLAYKKRKHQEQMDMLESLMAQLTGEIGETEQKIRETQVHMGDITATRGDEHTEYLHNLSEDEAATALLQQVINTLTSYYKGQDTKVGLVQEPEFEVGQEQAPDATLSNNDHRAAESNSIIVQLKQITEDLDREIANEKQAERNSQGAYEEAMHVAKQLKITLEEKKANLLTAHGNAAGEHGDEEQDRDAARGELDGVKAELKAIKPSCDWILGAFDKRRDHRRAESDGLKQARNILKGAAVQGAGLVQESAQARSSRAFLSARFASMQ